MKTFALCAAIVVLLLTASCQPCLAQHWQDLGRNSDSLDAVSIGTDSIRQDHGFRIVFIKTVYARPRTNKNNVTLDSHIQQTVFDCQNHRFYGIREFGYLNGKMVGAGPDTPDWEARLKPVGADPFSQRIFSVACTLPATGARNNPSAASPPGFPHFEGENLLFSPPVEYKVGYSVERNSMTEWIPKSQNADDWTEMYTVQIFHNLQGVAPDAFLQTIGKEYTKACPGFHSDKGIGNGHNNGYVVSMLVVNCPNNPATGKPETTLFRIIRGQDALYAIQHAWRSIPSGKDLADAAVAFGRVTVCDTRGTEHPCPAIDSVAGSPAPPKPRD